MQIVSPIPMINNPHRTRYVKLACLILVQDAWKV